MNDSSASQSGKYPSDQQIDGLLRDFFVLETPSALNKSFQRPEVNRGTVSPLEYVSVPSIDSSSRPVNRRLIVASAISVLAMSLILAVSTRESGDREPASSVAGSNLATPAEPSETLKNVSSQGDVSASTIPVGDDGVTLGETDVIEVKPQP